VSSSPSPTKRIFPNVPATLPCGPAVKNSSQLRPLALGVALAGAVQALLGLEACAWRINRIRRLSEFGTSLDSASATGTNRDQQVIQLLPQAVPARTLPARHAFDARYSTVESR